MDGMKAIVVGAGIAGLVTARQLGLAGWEVEVIERSPGPRKDGYMMDFFGPGVEASERIGLYPRLAAASYRVEAAQYVTPEGRVTSSLSYRRFADLAGGKVLSLLRPDMELAALDALRDVPAGRVEVRYGAGVGDAAVRAFAADADVVIGADGIHSEVRAQAFGPEPEFLRPLGMRAAAFIVTEPILNARFRNRFILTDSIDRMAGLYSLRTDEVAAFLVYRDTADGAAHDAAPATLLDARARLRERFAGLGPTVDRLLELCPEHPYDDVVAQIVMPHWQTTHLHTADRRAAHVVLVGDACGAVSLLAGQGGSLAIAGAALLGDLLGPVADPEGIPAALAAFEDRWRPFVLTAQASGRRAAASFLPSGPLARLLRRWVIRASNLPVIDGIVARSIVGRIAK